MVKGEDMSISKSVYRIIALGSLTIGPLLAQTTATAPTQTVGTNPSASNPTATATSTTTPPGTAAPKAHHARHSAGGSKKAVLADASRLGTLLEDVQTNANVPAATWMSVSHEAEVLANRIYSNAGGHQKAHAAAKDLRMHVREMRSAAKKGDGAGAKSHASEALPFANQLADWATPEKK
jgi:hypothetical protein